jgi:hypothetical protein
MLVVGSRVVKQQAWLGNGDDRATSVLILGETPVLRLCQL